MLVWLLWMMQFVAPLPNCPAAEYFMPFGSGGLDNCDTYIAQIDLHEEADVLAMGGITNCNDIILSGGTGGNHDVLFGVYWASTMNYRWMKTIDYHVWIKGI